MKILLIALLGSTAMAEDGVSEHEIVLGSSAAYYGASAALGIEQWRGFTAYFNKINTAGGVNGRKLRVLAYDDQYEPLYTVSNTVKLLDKDKVFALFGYVGTPTLVRALPVLKQREATGAFLFSNFTGAQPQREPPHDKVVFNIRASYREETAGLVDHLLKLGFKHIGAFLQDDAYGKSGEDGLTRALAAHQLTLTSIARYPRGMKFEESTAEQVRALQAAHVDAVIAVGAYQGCAAFIRDARAAGFAGPIVNLSFVGADALLDLLLAFEKKEHRTVTQRLINSQVVPNWSGTQPLLSEYRAAMDQLGAEMPKVAPATGSELRPAPRKYSFGSLEGYLDAKVFIEILRRMGDDVTRAGFRQQAETTPPFDLGLGVPFGFTASNHQALHQVWFTTVRNGQYVEITDWAAALK